MIKIGNSNIMGVSLGDTQFSKIYKGVDLYWSKTPSLIQVNIEFREGVISMTINGVKYSEPTTIYVDYKSTVVWSAEVQEGFEYIITSGEFNVNEKKVYYITVSNPTNEIWYTTDNNEPISLSDMLRAARDENDAVPSVVSNLYDDSNKCFKLVVNKNIITFCTRTESLFNTYPVASVLYLPESIEYINRDGNYVVFNDSIKSICINDLPNIKLISHNCYSNMYSTNYGNKSHTIDKFEFGNMNQLEEIGNQFLYLYSASNYTVNKLTINMIKIGNTPKLKTIGNYFIGVNTGAGNYPEATLTIGSLELGDMSNVETIGDYFLGGKNSDRGTSTINIDTITLPSMPKLKSVGEGAFANNKVKTIYVPTDCYDLYCNLFSSVKSKFVKI